MFLLFASLAVLMLAILMEWSSRKGWLPQWAARKILHVGAVGGCAAAPFFVSDLLPLILLVGGAELLLLYLVGSGKLFTEENGRRSWGIALFPLSYLVLLICFPDDRWMIALPMAVMAICDACAALAGHLFARRYYNLTGDRKSLAGNLAFVLSFLALASLTEGRFSLFWIIAALITAALEALGSKGTDNLLVPLGAALLFQHQQSGFPESWLWSAFAGLPLGLAFSWYSVRKKFLTLDGAVTATLLGIWVVLFAGPLWLIPLLVFFGSSVAIGRMLRPASGVADHKHGRARDFVQVICNGGVYALLAPWQAEAGMAVSMAISASDTWSSELGMYFRGKTIDIGRLRTVPPGLSGGVSWQGSMGGAFGAGLMAGICALLPDIFPGWTWIAWVGLGGFMGMLADSWMGSRLQARYAGAHLSDTPLPGYQLVSGWRWMTNDAVNLASNLLVTAAFMLLP